MALARGRRGDRRIDYWPGFVDALSTLLLAIMFLLSVFVLAQFLLSREISGKDEVLNRLNSQINELTQLLALEMSNTQDAEDQLVNLQRVAGSGGVGALAPAAASRQGRRRGRRGRAAHRHALRRTGYRASDQPAGAEPGRIAQPADRGLAQADRRAGGRAERVGVARPRVRTPRSPIWAAASTSRSPSGSRNSTATAPISSGGCARSFPTAKTSASSATASSFSRRCCFRSARRTSTKPAAPRWRSWRRR